MPASKGRPTSYSRESPAFILSTVESIMCVLARLFTSGRPQLLVTLDREIEFGSINVKFANNTMLPVCPEQRAALLTL